MGNVREQLTPAEKVQREVTGFMKNFGCSAYMAKLRTNYRYKVTKCEHDGCNYEILYFKAIQTTNAYIYPEQLYEHKFLVPSNPTTVTFLHDVPTSLRDIDNDIVARSVENC